MYLRIIISDFESSFNERKKIVVFLNSVLTSSTAELFSLKETVGTNREYIKIISLWIFTIDSIKKSSSRLR